VSTNQKLAGKRVCITGAGGFIGSHLVERCLDQGAEVCAFVHYKGRNPEGWIEGFSQDKLHIIAGDVSDPFQIKNAMEGCDVVFHLAALIGIPYSYDAPTQYVSTNINGTLNVLQAARELKTPRVIHTSTSEVYGTALSVPISEDHPLQAQSPYSATKIGADQLALSYYRSFDLPVTIVRPFNTFGPRQSSRAIIPTVLSQLISGSEKLKVGSLKPTRDLNFVTDTADGFIAAATTDQEIAGEVINLGTGNDISIGDLIELAKEITNSNAEIVSESERMRPDKSEVFQLVADNEKAKRLLNWEPRVSLRKGLEKTAEWIRQNKSEFDVDKYNV